MLLNAGDGAARELARQAGLQWVARPAEAPALAEMLRTLLGRKRAGNLAADSDPAYVRALDRRKGAEEIAEMLSEAFQ